MFERAAKGLRERSYGTDRVRRALDFHVIVEQSMMHGGGSEAARGWRTGFRTTSRASTPLPFRQLADRLRDVQIERRDALEVLERVASVERAVIYADPPYSGADTEPYGADVDREKLGEILRIQKGRAAISGYGDEWDRLGWRREEFEWSAKPGGAGMARGAVPRTEVLWCNYEPEASGLLGI